MSDIHHAEAPDPLETEAREYGWAPKDQFKGPEEKWRPAGDYLDWAKQTGRLPKGEFESLKRQFPELKQQNESLKTELSEIKTTLNQFVEFSSKAEERAFQRARQELEAKIETAAANADPAAARAAMRELEALKPEAKPEPKPRTEEKPQAQVDPVIQEWMGKESWYLKDRTLGSYATDIYGDLERDKPGMSTAERLAETKRRTMEKFPEKFGINPMRDTASAVASPSSSTAPRKKTKTYDDLPAEAKAACDKFVKQIPGYTREKYVKDYDWND